MIVSLVDRSYLVDALVVLIILLLIISQIITLAREVADYFFYSKLY